MKAYGKTKRNGTVTVKSSVRKININELLSTEACITQTYRLKEGEFFAKQTSGGNLFVYCDWFEGYIKHNGLILRETSDEFEFVDSFESDWEVVSIELFEPMYLVKLHNYNGCVYGLTSFLKENEQMQNNETAKKLLLQLEAADIENRSYRDHDFRDYGISDEMVNHLFAVYLTNSELEYFNYVEVESDLN